MRIVVKPEDEEIDYDGHEHKWKYVETYGDYGYDDGDYYECGVKRYTCVVCGIDNEVDIE
tara:strand:+ start:328 stop:507 length:180 start_codon:yes stop_codon:yes gene_type:complete